MNLTVTKAAGVRIRLRSSRMWYDLPGEGGGQSIKPRVPTPMQQDGIRACGKRRLAFTSDSCHDLPIAPNLLDRQFTVDAPDMVLAGDITDIGTDEGWLFLAVSIDRLSAQVTDWVLRSDTTRGLVINALRMAWFRRHPAPQAGLILHSDRGSQYTKWTIGRY